MKPEERGLIAMTIPCPWSMEQGRTYKVATGRHNAPVQDAYLLKKFTTGGSEREARDVFWQVQAQEGLVLTPLAWALLRRGGQVPFRQDPATWMGLGAEVYMTECLAYLDTLEGEALSEALDELELIAPEISALGRRRAGMPADWRMGLFSSWHMVGGGIHSWDDVLKSLWEEWKPTREEAGAILIDCQGRAERSGIEGVRALWEAVSLLAVVEGEFEDEWVIEKVADMQRSYFAGHLMLGMLMAFEERGDRVVRAALGRDKMNTATLVSLIGRHTKEVSSEMLFKWYSRAVGEGHRSAYLVEDLFSMARDRVELAALIWNSKPDVKTKGLDIVVRFGPVEIAKTILLGRVKGEVPAPVVLACARKRELKGDAALVKVMLQLAGVRGVLRNLLHGAREAEVKVIVSEAQNYPDDLIAMLRGDVVKVKDLPTAIVAKALSKAEGAERAKIFGGLRSR